MLNKPLPPPPIPQSQLPNPPLNLNNSPSTSNQYSEHSFYEQTSGKNSQNVEEVLGQKSISRSNSGSNFGNFGSVSSECNNFAVPGSSESDFVQISGSTTVLDRQDSVKSDSSTAKSIKLGLKSDTLSPSAAFGLTPSEDDAMQWRKSSIQSSVMFEVGEMNKQNNNTDSDSIDYGSDDDELPLSIVSSRLHCESESHDSSEPLTPRDSKPRLDFHKAETSEEEEGSSVTTPVEMPNNLPANVSPFKDEMNRNTSAATKHIVPEAVTGLKALSGSQSPPPRPHSALSVKEKTPRAELKIDSTSLSGEILKSLSPDLQDLPLNYDVIPRPASAPSGLISKRDKSHSLNVMVADKQFRSVRTTKILLDKNEHSSPPAVHSTDSYLLRRPNSSRPILMGSRPYSMLSSRDSSRSVGNVSRKLGESVTEDGLNEHKSSGKVQSNKLPREMDNISAISKVQEQNDMADAEEGTHRSLDLSVQSENLLTSVKEYQPFAPASMARVKELQKTENGYQKIRNSYPSAASSNYQAKAEVSSNFSGNRPSSEYASRPNTLPEVPPSHYEPPHPMPAYDPRFLPGHDPRFMPAYYPGYDPRFWPGYDPRILSGHDPRSMPGFDSRQYSPLSSPQPYPRDSYSNQPNLTHQSMADYYYGVTSATAAAPERQPSYVPPHFQSIRSQPHSASYSSSLAGYPIEPPIILKKTIPLAIPARNSSLHLSPALKRNSMALNNRGNENS